MPSAACVVGSTGGFIVDTEPPGYFDVGGGFAHINSANTEGASASGVLVTIKAYPWGRWYAARKKSSTKDVLEKVKNVLVPQKKADGTVDPVALENAKSEYVDTVRNLLEKSNEMLPLHGDTWYRRLSVFYGRSAGNFDETTIKGDVNSIGIEYDIAPEFALMLGVAVYQVAIPGGRFDTQEHLIFGVQMNFNAFSAFRGN